MRGIILLLLTATLLFGCAGETPAPPENITGNETTDETVVPDQNETEIECVGPVCGSDGITYETDCEAKQAGISIFTSGECVSGPSCTDSDGDDTSTKGSVKSGDDVSFDYCENETHVVEFTCSSSDEIESATLECQYGCDKGACLEKPPEPEIPFECKGQTETDILVSTSVTYNHTFFNDTCIDYTTVKDYYCKDGELKSQNAQCPPGYRCLEGACEEVVPMCDETDEGYDLSKRGRTIVSRGMLTEFDKWDECIDQGTVEEHYCDTSSSAVSEEIECGSGYKCLSGKCIESKCTETDGGFDIFETGETTVGEETKKDDCVSSYKIREYYCYGDDIKSDTELCPEDYICHKNKCVIGSKD